MNKAQNSKLKGQKYLRWLPIFLILVIAAFLRLYKISDYMTFLGDEGRDVLAVYNILHGRLTLLGPTASVGGFFLGPIYYYFMVPFLWLFNYNPVGPAVMVALFGVATVWLVYKVGSEFFDKKTGIIASLLYAISPLTIAYSRSSWNPNLMPFFSLLTLYVVYKAVEKNRLQFFLLCGVLLGVTMQLHYLTLFLGAIIAVYILFTAMYSLIIRQNISLPKVILKIIKNYIYILIGFIIGWSPFLLFEVRHGFPNIRSIVNFLFHSNEIGGNNHPLGVIWDVFFRLFGRLITKFPPSEQISVQASTTTIDLYFTILKIPVSYLYYFTVILALVSVVIFFLKFYKRSLLLFIWLFLGISLFAFYRKSIYDYYLGFMFPVPFLLVGYLLSTLYTKRLGKMLSVIIFTVLVLLNLTGVPFRHPPNRQALQVEEISRFVLNKTEGKPFNFALITGGNSDHAYRYFFRVWKHDPKVIENIEKDPKRKTVTDQLFVVCETVPCAPLGHSLWEVAGFGRAEIVGEWNVSVIKLYKLIHYKGS